MADREVSVKIRGTEDVSSAAKKSESALGAFAGKAKGLLGGVVVAAAAVGTAALAKFFKGSIDEAAEAELRMARLGIAVKNTGNDFNALKPALEGAVASVSKFSTASDEDLMAALTNLVVVSGDVEGSMKNLALVTDLAAFKNVDLETAAMSVGKAMNGNTTELNRLGIAGKDSTTVLENLRKSVGGFSAQESKTLDGALKLLGKGWQNFQQQVGQAILSGGEFGGVLGGLTGILGNLALWVEKNQDVIQAYVSAVYGGWKAVATLASAIWDVLGPPLTWLAKVGFAAVLYGMEGLALGVRRTAGIFQEFAGNALISIGTLVEKGGKLLKVFGVEVVASTGESIRQYGEQLVAKSQTTLTNATTAFQAGMKRLSDLRSSIRQKDENAEIKSTNNVANANKKAADEVKASHLDLEIARQKASAATNELLQKTAEALRKQNEELRGTDTEWGKNHTTVTNYLTSIKDLLPPVENLRDEIERNNAALKRNAETAKEAKQHFKDTVNEAVQIGRGLIDAAQAAGAMNSEMGSVLNSVLSIGESLASLSVDFSAGGLVGVIGGIANVVSAIGGSNKGVREALDSNRAALDRLSREVGNFNLGASGKTFSATEKAIAATEAAVREGRISGAGRESQARNLFRKELLKQGVSVKDAEALLEELGFGGALKGDEEFFASIKRGQLGQGLRDTEFGQFGRDFESQFRATTEGFGIHGTDKGGQLSELAALAGRFSPALKAALSSGDAKSALSGLFDQLKTGGLDAAAFGDLNANQFLDLLKSLLSLLDEGAVIPGDSEFTGGTKGKGFEIPIGGGLPRIPPLVPDDFGGIDPGFLTSLGRLSIPGLALPSFSTDLTSSLGAGKSAVGGGDSFTQQIAQNIQGDLINQYNITPRDGVDPEEIAEIVAQRLGERYSLQKQALGLG